MFSLHCACVDNDANHLRSIISQANVDEHDYEGKTPLHLAAAYNSVECIRVLCEAGANPNATTKKGDTPLDLATGQTSRQAIISFGGYW